MRNILLAVALVAGCSSPESFGPGPPAQNKSDLTSWCLENPEGLGTAFPYHMGEDGTVLLLTALHVVEGTEGPWILRSGDIVIPGPKVIRAHPTLDAAIVSVSWPRNIRTPELLALRADPPVFGEHVTMEGFGEGFRWVSDGRMAGPGRASLPAYPGDSGAPVRDEQGRVVGILVAVGPAAHHSWVVPMAALLPWITEG